MDYVNLDVETQTAILSYLKTDLRLYNIGNDQVKEQLESGILTKYTSEFLLSFLVDKCRSFIDLYGINSYTEEVNQLFIMAKENLDKVPKWDGYDHYMPYKPLDYSYLDIHDIYMYIKSCLSIDQTLSEVVLIINLERTARKVINSIDSINSQVELSPEILDKLLEVKTNIEKALLLQRIDQDSLKRCIDLYQQYAQHIWLRYLEDNENSILVHNCSKGEFDLKNLDYSYTMSASLITSKSAGLFKSIENSYYGLIIKPKRILAAEDRDVFAINNPSLLDGRKFYHGDYATTIMLPWEIEEKLVEKTIQENGQMLSYANEKDINMYADSFYSEVVSDDYEIVGIFFMSYGEGEMSLNYDEAYNMASINHLPLKEVDLCSLREENKVQAMTSAMKKNFFRNILLKSFLSKEEIKGYFRTYNGNLNQSSLEGRLIEEKADQFCDRYLTIKKDNIEISKELMECLLYDMMSEVELTEINNYYHNLKESLHGKII